MLFWMLRRRLGGLDDRRVITSLVKVLLASSAMAAVAWGVEHQLALHWAGDEPWRRAVRVGLAISLGLGTLALTARLLRAARIPGRLRPRLGPRRRPAGAAALDSRADGLRRPRHGTMPPVRGSLRRLHDSAPARRRRPSRPCSSRRSGSSSSSTRQRLRHGDAGNAGATADRVVRPDAGSASLRGFLWQPLTYLFLHAGFMHLIFNMLALWMFGVDLERRWGRTAFFRYYFVCGVGAAA